MGARDVVRPHGHREAVHGVVGDPDRLLFVAERDRRQHGPKDLLARNAHVVRDGVEDRRLDEIAAAVLARLVAAELELRAFVAARFDVAEHAVELRAVDDGAHPCRGIERISRLDRRRDLRDAFEELVLQRLVYEQPRAGVADLALVVEDAPRRSLGGGADVAAVLHHDVRRLAAAFECEPFHVRLAGVAQEELADFRRAGERDEIDVHVAAERLAGRLAEAGHDLEHAVRDTGLARELGEPQRGQRRLLGRLQHNAVAGGERGSDLPARHQQREVPRHDRRHDAERLAHEHDDVGVPGRGDLVVHLVDRLAVVRDALCSERHVHVARVANRLAHVERLEQRELVAVLAHELGETNEHTLPLLGLEARPDARLERALRAGDGTVDVFRIARRDLRDDAAGARADAVERLARRGVDVGAVDEGLRADRQCCEDVVDGLGHGAPPARSGSTSTTVRAPSPRRRRSSASSTPSRPVVCVTTLARSRSPASAREASSGRSRAASPEP